MADVQVQPQTPGSSSEIDSALLAAARARSRPEYAKKALARARADLNLQDQGTYLIMVARLGEGC